MKTLNKKTINIISIILISIGATSGLLIIYDYTQSPHLVSKEQALQIAIRTGNWNQNFLNETTIDARLLHVKTEKWAFLVDEKTLKDISPYCPLQSPCIEPQEIYGHDLKDGQYVWMIKATGKPLNILSNREWGYMIDATSGQVLR